MTGPPVSMQKVLSLNGLTKRFGTVLANDAVDLDLHKGEVLALLGENGAGKTTLMNMLFGHYMPDDGTVDVADSSGQMAPLPLGHPQAALAAGIGMVHQHFTLAENLNALDNIVLGAEPLTRFRRDRKGARAKIEQIMKSSGLVAPLDVRVGQLSVGERQRVEILKALYRDARILVLDEPTAVLTPQEADALFENIGAMTATGLSVIFISHKLREVLAFSTRWRSPTDSRPTLVSSGATRPERSMMPSILLRAPARSRRRRSSGSAPSTILSSADRFSARVKC